MQKIDIIIINWNGKKFIESCINSVLKQTHKPNEIIVIDNASDDGSIEIARNKFPDIRLILNKENYGFCRAANIGIKETKSQRDNSDRRSSLSDWIMVLNPDVVLDDKFLEEISKYFEIMPYVGMFSGKLMRTHKSVDSAGQFISKVLRPKDRGYEKKDREEYNIASYIFSVCGAAAIYKREMLEDIKINDEYFDEDFFAYYEEFDLAWRAQLKTWKAYYVPSALAYHFRGGVTSTEGKRKFKLFEKPYSLQKHIFINRYLVLIKNCRISTILLFLPYIVIYEFIRFFYILFSSPKLFITGTVPLFPLAKIKSAFDKRKVIQNQRLVAEKYIRSWVV